MVVEIEVVKGNIRIGIISKEQLISPVNRKDQHPKPTDLNQQRYQIKGSE
jgi:hypothetical protein